MHDVRMPCGMRILLLLSVVPPRVHGTTRLILMIPSSGCQMRMTSTRSLLKKILPWNLQAGGGRRGHAK